jgi:flagellar biosynthesis/type III secretory pathway ATPase
MPVGDTMSGRVVNALGEPIDGKRAIQTIAMATLYSLRARTLPVE